MSKRNRTWTQLEDLDKCLVHFKCPECSKEFYERGARVRSGKPIYCRACAFVWRLDKEQALNMIMENIHRARKAMQRFNLRMGRLGS